MLDRFFVNIVNAIALLGSVLAMAFLFFAVTGLAAGRDPSGDLAFAATISIVTYCLAGTIHRIATMPRQQHD